MRTISMALDSAFLFLTVTALGRACHLPRLALKLRLGIPDNPAETFFDFPADIFVVPVTQFSSMMDLRECVEASQGLKRRTPLPGSYHQMMAAILSPGNLRDRAAACCRVQPARRTPRGKCCVASSSTPDHVYEEVIEWV